MDIQLTEEQRQVRDLCRDFADKELAPQRPALGRATTSSRPRRSRSSRELGLLGRRRPGRAGRRRHGQRQLRAGHGGDLAAAAPAPA